MKYTEDTPGRKLLRVAEEQAVFRAKDLEDQGVPRSYLGRWVDEGRLERVGRGLYRLADRVPSAHQTLIEAARRIPNGVVCLLSALQFHELGTQLPSEVWMAVDRKAWRPKVSELPIRIVRFSGPALIEGIGTHRIDGVEVRIYVPAKTVADCFKYRHKIGLDVAIEALRSCREQRNCSVDDVWRYAKIDRVATVMRPYLEVLA